MEHFDWCLLSLLLFWWYNWVLLEKLSLLDVSFVVIDRVWCFLRKPPWGSSLQSKSILSYHQRAGDQILHYQLDSTTLKTYHKKFQLNCSSNGQNISSSVFSTLFPRDQPIDQPTNQPTKLSIERLASGRR